MKSWLFFCVLGLTACATTNQQTPGSGSGSGSGSGLSCHEVQDTGSMFSHTECTPTNQDEQQRHNTQLWQNNSNPHTTTSGH